MSFITGKHMPRRTLLRGLGATVALPFLDAMVPARALLARRRPAPRRSTARGSSASRWCTAPPAAATWGATQHLWSPAAAGRDFDLAPTRAQPARAVPRLPDDRQQHRRARWPRRSTPPEIGGDHFRSSAVFLTQAHPKQTEGSDVRVGTSLDQIYAQRFGQDTPIPSMQLCIENVDQAGGCAYGYACVYTDIDQLGVADRAAADDPRPARGVRAAVRRRRHRPSERAARRRADRSILDYVTGAGRRPQARARRRATAQRMERYLDDIREIERRIQTVEARNTSGEARELPGAPAGVPDSFDEHVKLMFDLQALAFAGGRHARVLVQDGPRRSSRVYPGERRRPRASTRRRTTATSRRASPSSRRSTSTTSACCRTSWTSCRASKEGDATLLDKSADHLRLADGRRQPAQPQALPADPARAARTASSPGNVHHQGAGRHADGQRDAERDAHARARRHRRSSATAPATFSLASADAYGSVAHAVRSRARGAMPMRGDLRADVVGLDVRSAVLAGAPRRRARRPARVADAAMRGDARRGARAAAAGRRRQRARRATA